MAGRSMFSGRKRIWRTLQRESLDTVNEATRMEYFRLIEDGEHEVMKDWPLERQAELLQLEHPHYCDMRPLEYALRSENFDFIKTIFDKCSINPISNALREKNQDGDNFVQLLAGALQASSISSFSVSRQQPVCNKIDDIKKLFYSIFALAADNSTMLFELFSERNVDNECAVLGLIKHAEATDLVCQWLTKLTTEKRIAALKEKVCYCGQRHETSDSKCDRWYNLLMCALTFDNQTIADQVYEILKKTSCEDVVTEIVLGRTRTEVEKPASSNSLLVVAERKKWESFNKLLRVLPKKHRARALLETNHAGKSALQELVQFPNHLQQTLKFVSNELKDLIVSNIPSQTRFMELKMPQDAIKMFDKEEILYDRYIIPKHSNRGSRPAAIILHANLGEDSNVDEAAAKDMEHAFFNLGWKDVKLIDSSASRVNIKCEVKQNIAKIKEFCSLLIFCITVGAAAILDIKDRLLEELANLPDFIPKVLIVDEYRRSFEVHQVDVDGGHNKSKSPEKVKLLKNVLVLQPTDAEMSDGSYLKRLATEVERGNNTLQEMHKRALEACAKRKSWLLQSTSEEKADGSYVQKIVEHKIIQPMIFGDDPLVRFSGEILRFAWGLLPVVKRNVNDSNSGVKKETLEQRSKKSTKTSSRKVASEQLKTKDIFLRKYQRECCICKIDLAPDFSKHSMLCFKCRSSLCDECDSLDKDERVVNIPGLVRICPLCRST